MRVNGGTWAVLISIFCTVTRLFAAEISYTPGITSQKQARAPTIKIRGEIDEYAVQDFSNYAELAINNAKRLGLVIEGDGQVIVELDSPGGNVVDGITIGSIVRRMNFHVKVPRGAICASACVYILAGGVARTVQGRVGIHRPYVEHDELIAPEQQKTRYKKLENLTKEYFEQVNIPVTLYDYQLRIPGNEVVWLTNSELTVYGLNQADPYYYEAMNAAMAKRLGLSKIEFTQLLSIAEKICKEPKTNLECFKRLLNERRQNK